MLTLIYRNGRTGELLVSHIQSGRLLACGVDVICLLKVIQMIYLQSICMRERGGQRFKMLCLEKSTRRISDLKAALYG